jgi:hypothetical protein
MFDSEMGCGQAARGSMKTAQAPGGIAEFTTCLRLALIQPSLSREDRMADTASVWATSRKVSSRRTGQDAKLVRADSSSSLASAASQPTWTAMTLRVRASRDSHACQCQTSKPSDPLLTVSATWTEHLCRRPPWGPAQPHRRSAGSCGRRRTGVKESHMADSACVRRDRRRPSCEDASTGCCPIWPAPTGH